MDKVGMEVEGMDTEAIIALNSIITRSISSPDPSLESSPELRAPGATFKKHHSGRKSRQRMSIF